MTAVNARVDVYFDYLCPYAWRGAEVADLVARDLSLTFEWHHFSIYQSHYRGSTPWHVWNERLDPDDETGNRGLLPFLASLAARRQGPDAFDAFRLALLRARHRERKPFDRATMFATAESSGLHVARFERDFADPEARTALAHEHCQASRRDIHVTPTFVFPGGHTACLRIKEVPADRDEAVRLLGSLHELLTNYPYLETVTRPRERRN
jgi:predicted DsbA family dithiol-disulfide isomerase